MSDAYVIEQAEPLRPIHVWTDEDGQRWACGAYDHGPFCRLCQRVDEFLQGCLENVASGNFQARVDADGQFLFRATAQGTAAAEDLVATDLDAAALYASAQRGTASAKLNPSEERVLSAAAEGHTTIADLVEHTSLTEGQVRQALDTLARVGYIEQPEDL